MVTAKVVIGTGWGDEGKGKLVDFYATPQTTVIRYNGGAQASHTVVRDGKRHVFRHFGSGTLKGATTYLSRYFIINPILYFRELSILGMHPTVIADPNSLVTAPFDMMINQLLEQSRDIARHGSCGVGINETMQRHAAGYSLVIDDLSRVMNLRDRLLTIRNKWVPRRLDQLGVTVTDEWRERLASDDILETFIEQCAAFRRQIGTIMNGSDDIVFEGAQGLLLDQDHYFFPHVTHSHTGLHNVVALAADMGIDALDVTYVTRAYATRHGVGPFPREVASLSYPDSTNVSNDWQGRLRFGYLDLDLLHESIHHDLSLADRPIHQTLAITCLDHVGDSVAYWQQKQLRSANPDDFVQQVCAVVGIDSCLTSHGPEATDITQYSGAYVTADDGRSAMSSK